MSQGPHTSRGHVPRHTSTSNDTDDATRILSPQTLADNDSADADATVPLSSIQSSYETDDDATEFLDLQDLPSSSPDTDATRAIPNPHEAPKPHESPDTVASTLLTIHRPKPSAHRRIRVLTTFSTRVPPSRKPVCSRI